MKACPRLRGWIRFIVESWSTKISEIYKASTFISLLCSALAAAERMTFSTTLEPTLGVNFKIAERMGLQNVRFFGKTQSVPTDDGEVLGGSGVVGEFAEPLAADDFILLLKQQFSVECVQANQLLRRPIKRVALCGGVGAFLLNDAIGEGADAFVTGEMHYHDFFGHEQQIQICSIGHYQSEQFTTEVFKNIIEKQCAGVKCHITQINTNPIIYI